MSNQKIDPHQIRLMARTGLSVKEISERLHCSEKQIRRIKKMHSIGIERHKKDSIIGTEYEKIMWAIYYQYESAGVVAQRFGVSRQAVWEYLKEKGEI